jgi:hypothetical protein
MSLGYLDVIGNTAIEQCRGIRRDTFIFLTDKSLTSNGVDAHVCSRSLFYMLSDGNLYRSTNTVGAIVQLRPVYEPFDVE